MIKIISYLGLFFMAFATNLILTHAQLRPPNALYHINADGTGLIALTTNPDLDYWNPAWSPDGTQLVLNIGDGLSRELTLMNLDGTNPIALTQNGRTNYAPVWSPDGSHIAFISQESDVYSAEVYIIRSDGTEERRLTVNNAWDSGISWSPDSLEIIFASEQTGELQIFRMNAGGTEQSFSTSIYGNRPSWSPDGQQIVFTSEKDGDNDIYIAQIDGSNERNLSNNSAWEDYPLWSPDGSRIAFVSNQDGIARLYTMDTDGGNIINLTSSLNLVTAFPTWSPDSQALIFMAREQTERDRKQNPMPINPFMSFLIPIVGLLIGLIFLFFWWNRIFSKATTNKAPKRKI